MRCPLRLLRLTHGNIQSVADLSSSKGDAGGAAGAWRLGAQDPVLSNPYRAVPKARHMLNQNLEIYVSRET